MNRKKLYMFSLFFFIIGKIYGADPHNFHIGDVILININAEGVKASTIIEIDGNEVKVGYGPFIHRRKICYFKNGKISLNDPNLKSLNPYLLNDVLEFETFDSGVVKIIKGKVTEVLGSYRTIQYPVINHGETQLRSVIVHLSKLGNKSNTDFISEYFPDLTASINKNAILNSILVNEINNKNQIMILDDKTIGIEGQNPIKSGYNGQIFRYGENYAIKKYNKPFSYDPENYLRILEMYLEVGSLGLGPKIHGFWVDQDGLFNLLMSFIDLKNVEELYRDGKCEISQELFVNIDRNLLNIFKTLAKNKIIDLDLHGANIMLNTEKGDCVLVDIDECYYSEKSEEEILSEMIRNFSRGANNKELIVNLPHLREMTDNLNQKSTKEESEKLNEN